MNNHSYFNFFKNLSYQSSEILFPDSTDLSDNKSGVNNGIFKSRSTGTASTASVKSKGLSPHSIMTVADWTSESPFTKFHDKNVVQLKQHW